MVVLIVGRTMHHERAYRHILIIEFLFNTDHTDLEFVIN